MRTISQAALDAIFSTESQEDLICLVTIFDPSTDNSTVLARLSNSWTTRLDDSSDSDIVYGVISGGYQFIYLPLQITLPTEEEANAPRASLVLYDATQHLVPIIRTLNGQPKVQLDLVLTSNPDTVEVSYTDLFLSSITYNANEIRADLAAVNYALEPFPTHSFTPQYFPGLF